MVITGPKKIVFPEEKLDKTDARLEHSLQKSLRCLSQKIGI
jgi:hypothetical protein